MSKTSKNGTGSGGDERNMYVRRYKSTSNPSKASSSNASLATRQRESEYSIRSKQTENTAKEYLCTGINNIKSKLRSPVRTGLGQPTNRVNRPNTVSAGKVVKKTGGAVRINRQMTKMKQETESLERKQKLSNVQTENIESTEQVENNKQNNESKHTDEQPSDQQENGSELNGQVTPPEENSKEQETKENGKAEQNGEEKDAEINEKDEEEFDLQLEAEDNCVKPEEDTPKKSSETDVEHNTQNELKTSGEEVQEDSQTDTESYSVDVVESTTSEMSEATESTAPSEIKDKDNENQESNTDAVSYDSSIMLKDVKIKLNDCLKDTKGAEESNADQSLPSYAHKEDTFGKTLRTISGRSSIGRMRHITLRDRQPSPNSSLFVNTSNVSFSEDASGDYRILRHRSALSVLPSSNGGTPIDRKRKIIAESSSAAKKPKIDESSLFNTSFEILKYPFSPRRPVKVSTPYKFQAEKRSLSTREEVKVDEQRPVKKWCAIM